MDSFYSLLPENIQSVSGVYDDTMPSEILKPRICHVFEGNSYVRLEGIVLALLSVLCTQSELRTRVPAGP